MKGEKRWTKEETDRLLRLIRTTDWRTAARTLRRSYGSVQGCINALREKGIDAPSRARHIEKPLSDEQLAWLRDHASASVAEMSAHVGLSISALRKKLDRHGLKYRKGRAAWSAKEDKQLRALAGRPIPEIAKRLGRSARGVHWRAAQLGISICPKHKPRWTPGELTELRRLIEERRTSAEIGEHLGKEAGCVRVKVRSLGLHLLGRSRDRGPRTPPAEQRLPYVAQDAPRERQGIPRPRRIIYSGHVAWCGQCCAPVVDSPKGWADHNARVHVAPRRVA